MTSSTLPSLAASSSKAVRHDEARCDKPPSWRSHPFPRPLVQIQSPFPNESLVQHSAWNPCLQVEDHKREIGNIKQLELTFYGISNISADNELQISLLDSTCHLLLECTRHENSSYSRGLHCLAVSQGLDGVDLLRDQLIRIFASCGSLENAILLFLKAGNTSVYSWHAIISAYVANNQSKSALVLFNTMRDNGVKPNKYVFTCMLKACGNLGDISQGRQLHQEVIDTHLDSDLAIRTSLIEMYFKCGMVEKAQEVFDGMPIRDVIMWNAMLAGYEQDGLHLACLESYKQMQQEGILPDKVTFFHLLKTCGSLGAFAQGMEVHDQIVRSGLESDITMGSTLVDMYGKCGKLEEAGSIFYKLPARDIVSWNVMISGSAHHGREDLAFDLFNEMQIRKMAPSKVTFFSILKACTNSKALDKGKLVHAQFLESNYSLDVEVSNALIDLYAKCGDLKEAWEIFNEMPNRDIVSWGTILAGYVDHGQGLFALQLFARMSEDGIRPDKFIFSSVVKACTIVGAIEIGKLVHEQIKQGGFELDVFVGTSLVDMYAKCDLLEEALRLFNKLPHRNLVSWNAIITGCALHGECKMAFLCLEDMVKHGLMPNDGIYAVLLSACSRAGLVDTGCGLFKWMREDTVVVPATEHFNCMVDLFARAGLLNEAKDILETMPIAPDATGWLSLLTSCTAHNWVNLGRHCFDQIVSLDPSIGTSYMLMSNLYSEACMWDEVLEVQKLRKCAGAKKQPGKCWVEVNHKVHEFSVGDQTHPQSEEIYSKLKGLLCKMEKQGYVPDLSASGHSATDKGKRDHLLGHAEKLAIAFGLLTTPEGATIRVTKNLKVCRDCHTVSKFISKLERRQIVISDAYCIHRFDDGICSCGDFY